MNGSSKGSITLRCENAFPPEDGSGVCACEGYALDPCADGANPGATAEGCTCSGRRAVDPCDGGIASAKVAAGQCLVTCKQPQP